MEKNGNVYEYTKWYKIKDNGGLECFGKDEPDWKKLLPPEPKPEQLPAVEYKGHLVMELRDYEKNSKLFKEYLAFVLEDCTNLIHPLYKNPDKALKGVSVRKGGVSRGKISDHSGTEKMEKCQDLWREEEPEKEDEDEDYSDE